MSSSLGLSALRIDGSPTLAEAAVLTLSPHDDRSSDSSDGIVRNIGIARFAS
jgi:hypothetical protein